MSKKNNLHLINHPMAAHLVGLMRNNECPHGQFRLLMDQLTILSLYETLGIIDVPILKAECNTPTKLNTGEFAKADVEIIDGSKIALVGIMRAGMSMSASAQRVMPRSPMGHIGIQRDEHGENVSEYYTKLPDFSDKELVLVFDPMIATGRSAKKALRIIEKAIVSSNMDMSKVLFISVICSKQGIEAIDEVYPSVLVVSSAQDVLLNTMNEIVPGLGDAGDRLFETYTREVGV